jgi:hypothetical protein
LTERRNIRAPMRLPDAHAQSPPSVPTPGHPSASAPCCLLSVIFIISVNCSFKKTTARLQLVSFLYTSTCEKLFPVNFVNLGGSFPTYVTISMKSSQDLFLSNYACFHVSLIAFYCSISVSVLWINSVCIFLCPFLKNKFLYVE